MDYSACQGCFKLYPATLDKSRGNTLYNSMIYINDNYIKGCWAGNNAHTLYPFPHIMLHFDALKINKAVENIVRKEEIDCHKQFLLFLTMFRNPI